MKIDPELGATVVISSDPVPRRRQAWGTLWSKAPWDGKPVAPTPVVAPAAPAAVAPLSQLCNAPRGRVLARTAFGKLLQQAPWTAKPLPVPPPELLDTPAPGLEATPPPVGQLNPELTPSAL